MSPRRSTKILRTAGRWLKRGLLALGIGLVALLALLLAVLDLEPTREFTRAQVNAALSDTFRGKILLDRIGSVRLDRIAGIDARLLDARGRRVVTLRGLRVRSNWPELVRDLVLGRPLHVELEPLSVDHLEVLLVADDQGLPTLASAFEPRQTAPATTPKEDEAASAVSVRIGELHVRHLWAHGSLPSLQVIDAELSELRGSFEYGALGLQAELASARLRARALPAEVNPRGSLRARVRLPAAADAAFSGDARFEGELASAPATLRANWKLPELEAVLLAPAVQPTTLRALLPSSRIEGATELEASVRGRLPTLEVEAKVRNQAADARLKGQASLRDSTELSCELVATNVDLGPILGSATRTSLSATASAHATLASDGAAQGEYRASVARGRFGTQDTPALSTTGKLARSSQGATKITGQLQVDEPGAATRADYRLALTPEGRGSLHVDLESRLEEPPRLSTQSGLKLRGSLDGSADLELESQQISASLSSRLSPVNHPSFRARSLNWTLKARGALASPELELKAEARELSGAGRRFQTLELSARGKPERLRIAVSAESKQQRWQAEALLRVAEDVVLDDPRLGYSDRDGRISARARRIRIGAGKVQIDELGLDGLGEVRATGWFSSRRAKAEFTVHELDLARVARLSGVPFARAGTLNLTGNVEGSLAALEGKIQGRARDLDFGANGTGKFEVDLELAGRKLNGALSGELGRTKLEARLSDVDLPAAPFTPERLQALRGQVSVRGNFDLPQLLPALQSAGVPLERARGQLELDLQASNPRVGEDAGQVRLEVRVKSQGLALVEQRLASENIETPEQARAAKPLAIEGIDLDLRLALARATERAEVEVSLFDRQGQLLAVEGEARLPQTLAGNFRGKLSSLPLRVSVRAPQRPLQKLPSALRPSLLRGLLSFELDAEGSVQDPKLRAKLAVQRLQTREGRNWVDLTASSEYANTGGKLEAEAKTTRGGSASLRSNWLGNLIERARTADAARPAALDLSTDLVLDKFPVALVPDLQDSQVRGPLSGEVRLRGLGKNAQLEAHLDGSGISVNRVAMPRLKADLRANDHELVATLDATQPQGNARIAFSAPSTWGAAFTPQLGSQAKLDLAARAFELEALSPLLMRYVSALEGSLDANFSAKLDPNAPQIQGTATLRDGVVQLPQLGQRFSDIKAQVSVRDNEIRVDSLQARGVTGRLTAQARARLQGTSLKSASAKLEIKEKEKVPVTLEGVVLGDAWGNAALSYTPGEEGAATEIKVDVPAFRLQMPDVAQNSVQDLDPADEIRIGAHRADGKFVAIPLQPFETDNDSAEEGGAPPSITRVRIHLGDSVWVDRGRQASVQLTGDLQLESGAEQQVSGRIELKGGKLDVSGKQFEIERGVISFEGTDPSDPTVTATARWDSPAEYTVYAEYAGTIKNGKLKLRAEPSLSQDEILSLLLFGAPSGSMGSSEGGPSPGAGAAVSVAGDTATKGLNRAISDVTSLDVSTRIDTSTGSARPELVVQLTPRLTTRVTRALGEPSPGQSPDRTFLTLELRLKRSWAISAVVGDHGASALDLIWRKRY